MPPDKVVDRYYRSLELAREAVRHADRAYFFDTSGPGSLFVAEVAGGTKLERRSAEMPNWFKHYLWDRF